MRLLKASNSRFVRRMDSTNFESSLCACGLAEIIARGLVFDGYTSARVRTRKNLSIAALRVTADGVPLFDGRVVFFPLFFRLFLQCARAQRCGERVSKNSRLLPRSLFRSRCEKMRHENGRTARSAERMGDKSTSRQ